MYDDGYADKPFFLLYELGPPDPDEPDMEQLAAYAAMRNTRFGIGRVLFVFTTIERARVYAIRQSLWHFAREIDQDNLLALIEMHRLCGTQFVTVDPATEDSVTVRIESIPTPGD